MDECWLEDISEQQRIGAAIFTPFVTARLQGAAQNTEATLTVELRGIPQVAEARRILRLRWRPESAPTQPLGVSGKGRHGVGRLWHRLCRCALLYWSSHPLRG